MATRRLSMRKIREVLRLKHEGGLTHEAIARACGVSKGAVSNYSFSDDVFGSVPPTDLP